MKALVCWALSALLRIMLATSSKAVLVFSREAACSLAPWARSWLLAA